MGTFLVTVGAVIGPQNILAGPSQSYSALFSEEILTVSRERDGLLPGTLRTALIQASGIRSQNSFTLVKIIFDPKVRRVRIDKGPLPEIDGSLTTIDCSHPQGKVILEYVPQEDDAGEDPTVEPSVLKLTSNGNHILYCHITGASGPGISVHGNRNVIENNAVGFHPEVPETQVPASALFDTPRTNGKSGIHLGNGANENVIQYNDIVGNTFHGVLLDKAVGAANRISYNFFSKNSGQAIKAEPGSRSTVTPTIHKITQDGENFIIEGISSPHANIQIYLVGADKDEVGMLVAEGENHPKNSSTKFTISTKSKGFVLGETQLLALAQSTNMNTSEFSAPALIESGQSPSRLSPSGLHEGLEEDPSGEEAAEESTEPEYEDEDDNNELPKPQIKRQTYQPAAPQGEERPDQPIFSKIAPQGSNAGNQLGSGDAETVVNIHGQGNGGGTPDSGTDKQNDVSSLGI